MVTKETTNQLKGLAIFAVIFSHIGYFLYPGTNFLYPLSVAGGVGVNIFLFLSGFGLTVSRLANPYPLFSFYKKRLLKLFIPLWIVIAIFLLLDFFILQRLYPASEVINSFLGFYPRADLWQNLDSPLWYFSIILFYYLIFPLIFIKKISLISPFLVLLSSLLLINFPLPIDPDVVKLYKLHFLAFPLGMLSGLLTQKLKFKLHLFLKILILVVSTLVFLYTAINSGVGQKPFTEQGISMITTLSAIAIFSLLKFNFRLLSFFGIYSYEIYLFHWPILSRYNLFSGLPPFPVTLLSLILFMILAYILQKIISSLT
ncbi:acyltransferase [Candidatus Daviesbacteria bacterium]|nr:acyltransferase [Candidatus Daviesbacteria bacterium]